LHFRPGSRVTVTRDAWPGSWASQAPAPAPDRSRPRPASWTSPSRWPAGPIAPPSCA